jgi:flagellar hook-basal body protein
VPSSPAGYTGGYMTRATVGHDFGSTDSLPVVIVAPTAEVDTFAFDANIANGGDISVTGGAAVYSQDFITSHSATLDALVATINAGETNFKASRSDSKIVLTAYNATALPNMAFTATTDGTLGSVNVAKEETVASEDWSTEGGGTFDGTNFVSVSVDGSDYQTIDIPASSVGYTGTELAAEMTRQLNSKFGDEKSYEMPESVADRTITLKLQDSFGNDINKDKGPEIDSYTYGGTIVLGGSITVTDAAGTAYSQVFDTNHRDTLDALVVKINAGESNYVAKRVDDGIVYTSTQTNVALPTISVSGNVSGASSTVLSIDKVDTAPASSPSDLKTSPLTIVVDQYQEGTTHFDREQLVINVQAKVDAVTYIDDSDVPHTGLPLTVGYDLKTRALTFTPNDSEYGSIKASSESGVTAFGLDSATAVFSSVNEMFTGGQIVPTGTLELDAKQQRTGLLVTYSKDSHKFSFSSGTTGETSNITVGVPSGTSSTGGTSHLLGIGATYSTEIVNDVGTGLASTSGMVTGSKAGVDITGTFSVTSNDNTISVTIDGVDGTVVVPPAAYTGHTFAKAIQDRINLIQHEDDRQVNDVTVEFDQSSQVFTVTSGTVGENSSVNINGHSNWGFDTTTQTRGTVPDVTVVTQATDTEGNLLYIDQAGNQTTQKPASEPAWTPIYLDKGELTFDTYGKLISPKEGVKYSPFDPSNGSDLLTLGVDYGKFSTQYSAPFSVLSLSQDGYPSGQLDGLDIDSGGVVRANYTNGTQVALGKLMMANFANPNGLKQVGNANFVSTTNSGAADLGEAGSDGFGDIQGGALERANVDLTEELVNLITAQRNFQANAKAIETSSSLTQTIINIRG